MLRNIDQVIYVEATWLTSITHWLHYWVGTSLAVIANSNYTILLSEQQTVQNL